MFHFLIFVSIELENRQIYTFHVEQNTLTCGNRITQMLFTLWITFPDTDIFIVSAHYGRYGEIG